MSHTKKPVWQLYYITGHLLLIITSNAFVFVHFVVRVIYFNLFLSFFAFAFDCGIHQHVFIICRNGYALCVKSHAFQMNSWWIWWFAFDWQAIIIIININLRLFISCNRKERQMWRMWHPLSYVSPRTNTLNTHFDHIINYNVAHVFIVI